LLWFRRLDTAARRGHVLGDSRRQVRALAHDRCGLVSVARADTAEREAYQPRKSPRECDKRPCPLIPGERIRLRSVEDHNQSGDAQRGSYLPEAVRDRASSGVTTAGELCDGGAPESGEAETRAGSR